MARGVNKAILVGTLGADPEVRYTSSGSAIASWTMATNETWTDKQTGQKQERTEWHRCKAFGRLAEIVGDYAKKGRQCYAEGSIRTSKYTDREGVERYSTEIVVDQFQLLGGNPEAGQQAAARAPQQQARQPQRREQPRQQEAELPPGGLSMQEDFDDGIPF